MTTNETYTLQERYDNLYTEWKQQRTQIKATIRRAESAEAIERGMVNALRGVFPPGFVGDNPVWACEKVADQMQDMAGQIESLRVIIDNLHVVIESQAEETKAIVSENDALRTALDAGATLAIEAYIAEHPRATFGEIVDAVVSANPRRPQPPTYAELAAENARLRAALERLLGELPQPNLDDPDLDDAIDAASDVLGKDQPNANT